ncbi:MAG: hypothetical protein LBU12_01560 [Deltaproteobacteria bacterium]|nr:hypothetical protein [Deltaproteobacteria bacterium]
MFKAWRYKLSPLKKAEVFSRLDFLAVALSRLTELVALFLALSWPGRSLSVRLLEMLPEKAPQALVLGPLALAVFLFAWPARLLRSQLRADFGLDRRSAGPRVGRSLAAGAALWGLVWGLSWGLDAAGELGLLAVGLATLAAAWLLLGLEFAAKRKAERRRLRDMTAEETPQGLAAYVKAWQADGRKGGLKVSGLNPPGLTMPSAVGRDLVATEAALAAFPPNALKSGLLIALLKQSLGLERNYLILRAAALALAAPTSVILINLASLLRWGAFQPWPWKTPLIWLAIWLAWRLADLTSMFVQRVLCLKLNEATVSVLRDATGLLTAVEIMAARNLVPWRYPWWRRLFAERPGPLEQLEKLRDGLVKRGEAALAAAAAGAAAPKTAASPDALAAETRLDDTGGTA